MRIRVGYELIYEFPKVTPIIVALNIHFTRVSDLVRADHIITQVATGLFGVREASGTIRINGTETHIRNAEQAMDAGLVYLPEDRKEHGLILTQDMRRNLTLLALRKFTRVLIDRKAEEAARAEERERRRAEQDRQPHHTTRSAGTAEPEPFL